MKKPLTFLLSLTFLFLFSSSSGAGIFSPDDWTECVFKNIENIKNKVSVVNTFKACRSKFPNKPIKGNSGIFGPKNYDDCILKYGKEVEISSASKLIQLACISKFKKFTDPDKNSGIENSTKNEDLKPTPENEKKYFSSGFEKTEGTK